MPRSISVKSSKGDPFLFHHMLGGEGISRDFRYDVVLLSESDQVAFEDMLGEKLTVELELVDGGTRHFNGYVSQLTYLGTEGVYARYHAVLRPWLWFLTRNANCRIFQNQTVPDIVRAVFDGYPFAEYEDRLSETYEPREYCVQYRESDFDYVNRLLESEGIYYFFEHAADGHKLIVADAISAHSTGAGYEEVPYFARDDQARLERDHIYGWCADAVVQPGRYALQSFDFLKPKADLMALTESPMAHGHADGEIYDYPGCYTELARGDVLTRIRLEELHSQHRRAHGEGPAAGLAAGRLFTLKQYPRQDQNLKYLVINVEHEIWADEYRAQSSGGDAEMYLGRFEVMPASQPFRPPQRTPKPIVRGPQTAMVVGKEGEEIWTNEHGCVKVHFHWDREGQCNGNDSCWVRVSQLWAGSGFGGLHVPRCGQEVIVDFLEGDPDKPIITGRVYNALCPAPFKLPGSATQSGIKSESCKGGGGANELRFEDRKGEEQVYLHAQKNQDIVVENDTTEHVKNDKSSTIGHDRAEEVVNDYTQFIGNNRNRTVNANETVGILGNQDVAVGQNRNDVVKGNETRGVLMMLSQNVGMAHSLLVGANQSVSVGGNQQRRVTLNRSADVGANDSLDVTGNRSMSVKGAESISVSKDRTAGIDGNDALSVNKNRTAQIKDNDSVKVGKNFDLNADDQITIGTGDALIQMKKDGTIVIKGKDITVDGSGKITIKAKDNVVIKGKKVLEN